MNIKEVLNLIKDYIFPVYCLGCREEGEWLCEKCFHKIDITGVFCCPACHKNTQVGDYCMGCNENLSLDSIFAITAYKEEGLIGKVIQTLKYSYAEDVLSAIEELVSSFIKQNKGLFSKIDLVVPVPLHKKRFVERGFNQAKLIAEVVAHEIEKPCREIVTRNRHTLQQAKLGREDRLKNVSSAFFVQGGLNENILLIDDVFTTGTTLQECAKALKEGGAKKVIGFTVARG
ncbi:MAG: ComF family protein [Candidatus Magasanikbacteria bacterium]|jgi:competence protein ComFC|nr:ComF family protein [Candidatus Magasanikbacteria bacterium]MBT4314531.1 ComF family protein [Candidatus Magasanikbacteria bacterium]MBT4547635.1 ComF family protein [Candidatus Magasanikbacteria bacterium]MBT6819304.1 ComF family protein [Candidatus Magasanikbacteria bacterium]